MDVFMYVEYHQQKKGGLWLVYCMRVESLSRDKINVFDASRCSDLENDEVTAAVEYKNSTSAIVLYIINITTYLI